VIPETLPEGNVIITVATEILALMVKATMTSLSEICSPKVPLNSPLETLERPFSEIEKSRLIGD
jgi:hypothetical protein